MFGEEEIGDDENAWKIPEEKKAFVPKQVDETNKADKSEIMYARASRHGPRSSIAQQSHQCTTNIKLHFKFEFKQRYEL